jgi:hypothetical protein
MDDNPHPALPLKGLTRGGNKGSFPLVWEDQDGGGFGRG